MKDEFTTKMHSEFTVTPETEIKHTVWKIMQHRAKLVEMQQLMEAWGISKEDFNRHRLSYPEDHPYKKNGI